MTCSARKNYLRSNSTFAGTSGGEARTRYVQKSVVFNILDDHQVAAQNCRKRKIEQIDELQEKLDEAKRRQYQLQTNHEKCVA